MTDSISSTEWLRVLLIYIHLILSMLALTRVLAADVGLIFGRLSRKSFQATVHCVFWLLLGLWFSGLLIIWLDTGFDLSMLTERTKLLLKLVSVTVLTFNGVLLHSIAFPVLMSNKPLSLRTSLLLSVTGSLSTLHWLLAAFVGVSKPLGRLPLMTLLEGYFALCFAVIIVSIACLGLVRRHILNWRKVSDSILFVAHVNT